MTDLITSASDLFATCEGMTEGKYAVGGVRGYTVNSDDGWVAECARAGDATGFAALRNDAPAIIRRLLAENERLRAMIRVNFLRFGPPGTTHETIDAAITAAISDEPEDARS